MRMESLMADNYLPFKGKDAAAEQEAEPEGVPFIDLVAQYQQIRTEVQETVNQVFEEQAFVLGDRVKDLESEIARYCDSRYAIGCASGTDALVLSLMAMDIGPGDEVITSPFTFFATASSIHRVGARPVFVDIDPVSFNLDTAQVEAAVTNRTRAIMPVHLFGQCAEMEPLWRIAVRCGLQIIEDACQAIGAEYRGRRAGVLGTVGCFSFFPTKNLGGAGDGGIITTDDAELAGRLNSLRVHGESGQYNHLQVGLNSRLDALQAAVLSVKLRHLDGWSEARRQNARLYGELFRYYGLLDAVDIPQVLPERRHVYNQYSVRVRNGQRDEVLQKLRAQKIGCGIYYPKSLHLQTCFESLGYKPGQLPQSEQASEEIMALPIFSELNPMQLETVVRGVSEALGRSVENTPYRHQSEVRRAA